jgi:hypothetical protein
MPRLITPKELRQLGPSFLAEQRQIVAKAESSSPVAATFLSHSTKDVELLPGVIALLERHGAKVYLDKRDTTLPAITSPDTGAHLRTRIAQSKRFVLFATVNSKDSRWVPWELGLADGSKGDSKVAVLPSADFAEDSSWVDQEYLGMYRRIVFGPLQGHLGDVYFVWDRVRNVGTELRQWLSI